MPGAAGQLRKLYQHTSGGVNPPQAPNVSGDIGAMLKYLVASPPGLPEIRKAMVVPAFDETDGQTLQATMGGARSYPEFSVDSSAWRSTSWVASSARSGG